MKTKMFSRVGYKEVFNKSADIKKLIDKIEIEPALEFLTVLNKFEYKVYNGNLSELKFICDEWLANSDNNLKNKVINYYNRLLRENKNQRDSIDYIKIINKAATLRVTEILLSKSSKKNITPVSKYKNDEESLFILYLAINDEIAEREKDFFKKYLDFKDEKKTIRLHLYLGLNQFILNSESLTKKIWTEALKFVLFEKWIKNQKKYNNFIEDYLTQFGVKDLYELFNIVFQLNTFAISHYKFKQEIDDNGTKFFEYISNHQENSSDWSEFSEIRKNPLYKLSNGDYLILDFSFLLDKFFSGIYHDILEQSNKNNIKSFHQDYSTDFVEKFLLVNALNAVFGKSYMQFDENGIKEHKIKGIDNLSLPDYYVRNGNKIFLFECKNSFLSNKSKLDSDYKDIENEIKEKFYSTGEKKKAVKQLINYIELSQKEKYKFFDNCVKLEKCTYYPILVTTDLTLTSLGFNRLLNEYMEQDINNLDFGLRRRIKPLTIIHINDLLLRTTGLKKMDLLIEDYYKYCKTQKVVDEMISFSDYLDTVKFKNNSSIDHNSFKKMIKSSILSSN